MENKLCTFFTAGLYLFVCVKIFEINMGLNIIYTAEHSQPCETIER